MSRIQEERDGRYFVLVCFNSFIPCPFLPGGDAREGWGFDFGLFKHFFTMNISPGLRRGHPLAEESLLTVAAVMVCIQAEPDEWGFGFGCV